MAMRRIMADGGAIEEILRIRFKSEGTADVAKARTEIADIQK